MSQTVATAPAPPAKDERIARRSPLARLLARPELGALVGAIVIYAVFFIVAPPFRDATSLSTVLYQSSVYGIPAIAVAVLMIGGEFDLSAGVAVTSSALVASMFSYQFTANMWVGVVVSLAVALAVGFVNGYLVVRTGIPSFLVTLGTFFMLRGLNLALTKQVTGNVATNDVSNIKGSARRRTCSRPSSPSAASTSRSRCSGGSCSSSSRRGSCSGRESATGSSRSGVRPRVPGPSAFRSSE